MHLNAETALDLAEGRLPDAQAHLWREHIRGCRECSRELSEWDNLSSSARKRNLRDAPQSVLDKACAIFQDRTSLQVAFAELLMDSGRRPAFAGMRGQSASRQMVLRAEEFDIQVRVWTTQDKRELLGQILPRGTGEFMSQARLHLLHNGDRVSTADVNQLGEFHFSFVPDGLLSLQIDLPHLTVIGALDLS